MHQRIRRALGTVLSAALLGSGLVALDVPVAQAATSPMPPTPAGLTASIEPLEPYVGQTTCDPVAKPGVVAFRNLLLRTYRDSGSLGIVRDCGSGMQSEHKEGRAFDWAMSAFNRRQKAEVAALFSWLLATDRWGNQYAMARRLGIMYMIWDHHIFKLYDGGRGWQAYHGENPHTNHVHFSFGWNGAKAVTSYWHRTVAPIDFGPDAPPHVTPVARISNIPLVRQWGSTTLSIHSSGAAVKVMQRALLMSPADGDFGPDTTRHVARFQVDHGLPATQRFGPAEWKALFPFPTSPFGGIDTPGYALGNALVRGWALDADTTAPIEVTATVDGQVAATATASVPRDDVASSYPEWGSAHGFALVLPVTDGPHQVCLLARNAPTTPGTDTSLGCVTVQAQHSPVGGITTLTSALGKVSLTGWALDPDVADPITTSLTVDGAPVSTAPAAATRADIAAAYPGMGDQHGVTAALALPEGKHTVCLLGTNAPNTPGVDATLGCAQVTVEHSPVGALESALRAPGGIRVSGWALDPDVADPTTVDIISDGTVVTAVPAGDPHLLPATYAPQGTTHGFSVVVDLPAGTHTVCVSAHNAAGTPGTDHQVGCAPVVVSHDPAGLVTAVRTVPGGAVLLTGDAYDPDTLLPATVTALVDGTPALTASAGLTSATAPTRWPGYGGQRAFSVALTPSAGRHTVCARAENAVGTPGTAVMLGCATVWVHDATGALTGVSRSGRTVLARGWALDPDSRTPTVAVLLVDGRAVLAASANRPVTGLDAVAPGYGAGHGFVLARAVRPGQHTVCVVARNLAPTPGSNRYVGCRSVRVP